MNIKEVVTLYFFDRKHRLGELVIDAVIKETHELRATATEHPVESGSTMVDHIHNEPVTVQIEGVISNTPMSAIGLTVIKSLANSINDQSNNHAEKAFETVEKLFAERKPITIATSLKEYKDMVLESLSVERTVHTSASLHFRATAKQIRIVNQAKIPNPKPKSERAKSKVNLGKQDSKTASEEVVKKAKDKVSFFGSLFGFGS